MDARVRELERQWLDSRRPADQAAYLQARIRAGTISNDQLHLLSYLGHGGAAALGGHEVGTEPGSPEAFESWVRHLGRFGEAAWCRVCLALLSLASMRGPRFIRGINLPEVEDTVRASLDSKSTIGLAPLLRRIEEASHEEHSDAAGKARVEEALLLVAWEAVAACDAERESPESAAIEAARLLLHWPAVPLHEAFCAVQAELTRWALR